MESCKNPGLCGRCCLYLLAKYMIDLSDFVQYIFFEPDRYVFVFDFDIFSVGNFSDENRCLARIIKNIGAIGKFHRIEQQIQRAVITAFYLGQD